MPAQKPTAVFSALPLRGRSRTDMSPVRTGRKAASSKNPAVIFAWGPGKIQTKASTPRPADGGHDRAFYKRALRGGGGGARSDGKRSEVRIQRSGKAPKGRQGGRGRGGGAKRRLKHAGARPVDGARRGQRRNGTAEQPLRSASAATEQPHGRTRTDTDRHGRREVSG